MAGNVVLNVNRLINHEITETTQSVRSSRPSEDAPSSFFPSIASSSKVVLSAGRGKDEPETEEEEPLIQTLECRICQEEDHIKNLETPCACSGSLKYVHRTCVQRWCDEKGDITCEICQESYKPGYTAAPRANPDETIIDISGSWTIMGTQLDIHDPRVVAIAAAQRRFLEAEYDEYAASNASGPAFCRSATLILMALLLLRHALTVSDGDEDDDASTVFSLFLLRAAEFLLPCYIMAWAISILQRRRQTQEAAALAATEVAFILQSGHGHGHGGGLQFLIAPDSPTTPQREPHQDPDQ